MRENPYFEYGGGVSANASHEQFVAAMESAERVRAWCESTEPVTFQQEWWRAVARPRYPDTLAAENGRVQSEEWHVFAGCHTDARGNPYPDEPRMFGEYVGSFPGTTPPDAETVAAMVAAWAEGCE